MNKKLNKIFKKSKKLLIDDNTKIVIMSDCHRGEGNHLDSFYQNHNIFLAALQYYYNKEFTYIELGDGDEMWEVNHYENIIEVYLDIFKQLKKFYDSNRLIMIYGNHDIVKKNPGILKKYFYKYFDNIIQKEISLLKNLVVEESLILDYKSYEIFLIHGHQVDFLNSNLWRLSRFLVKNVWKVLKCLGVKNPIKIAKNYSTKSNVEKRLEKWSKYNNKILIAGHTHKPIFPKVGQSLYFNDGSCIHPNGITCLEIENGNIKLVKWEYKINELNLMSVERQTLTAEESITNFFK